MKRSRQGPRAIVQSVIPPSVSEPRRKTGEAKTIRQHCLHTESGRPGSLRWAGLSVAQETSALWPVQCVGEGEWCQVVVVGEWGGGGIKDRGRCASEIGKQPL